MKKRIKRKKGLLLASLLLFVVLGLVVWQEEARGSDTTEAVIDQRSVCPECKVSAYMGLDDHDFLTLFDGKPKHDQIVRRLFQINVEAVKESLPEGALDQLIKGIPITDQDEYNSVLSSFSTYANE